MRIQLKVTAIKNLDIDIIDYEQLNGLEGEAALDKILDLVAKRVNKMGTEEWSDSEKLELLENGANRVVW